MQPAIFFGHGNPMNALAKNRYTQAWAGIGQVVPKPKAVLMISAHWYVPGTGVTVSTSPRTIHDFGGFPRELYQVQYPAPGDPALARRIRQLLSPQLDIALDESWGLDHGTWSVLCHVYPAADVPVAQLSVDLTQPPAFHYELGQRLAQLRDEGVLIAGSGNIVHNLRAYAWGRDDAEPYDWVLRFESEARGMLEAGQYPSLIDYAKLGRDAELAIPTPDHYLPLLYVAGAAHTGDRVSFPAEGVEGGSVSMLAVQIG